MNHTCYLRYGDAQIRFVALREDEIVAEADTHGDLVHMLKERNIDATDVVFATREVIPEEVEEKGLKEPAGA